MELKYTAVSIKFSEEEKNVCKQMCTFLLDIIQNLDSANSDGLNDYYGSSWDRETLSDFSEFCNRIENTNNKNEGGWELE